MTAKWMIWRGWSVQLSVGLWLLIGHAIAALAIEPALAETLTPLPESDPEALESTPAAALTAEPETETEQLIVELAQNQPVQITDIQIEAAEDGFSLRLEASGELAAPETSVTGNAAIADISNAVLQLPDGDEFFISDPVEGISLIDVSALPDNQVRIAITGINAPPTVTISVGTAGLVVSGAPGDPAAQALDDETIQIIVTGENEDDYFVPNASTATRTDTRILDIPQAIQVIPQQVLEDQQILRIDDALRNVSGVAGQLDSFSNAAALTLRGFTTNDAENGPILRDGFRITSNYSSQEIANVERIEVIKGPSSVLYGQADPGGLINLVTERPLPFTRYDVEFQSSSLGLVRPTIDLTGPLTEDGRLAYRLNLAYRHEDSFRGVATDTSRLFFAPVVSWDISDRSNLTLVMEFLDEEVPFDVGLPVIGTSVVDVPRDRVQTEPDDFIRSESLTLGYDFTHEFIVNWTLNHVFRYVTQDYFVLVTLPGAIDEATGNVPRFFGDRQYYSNDYIVQTNVVGNFNTGSIQHTLLAGVDVNITRFDEEFTRLDFANPTILNIFNPVYGTPRPDLSNAVPLPEFNSDSEQYGVFIQDQITLSEQFILVGSLRYDSISRRAINSRTNTAWSPRIGFIYQPTEAIALYGNYSRSFSPNNGRSSAGEIFEPERGEGFEVGVKAELLGGNLLATLTYFDITKQNVLTADPNNLLFSIATGAQRSQGVEFDIVGEILPGWNIIANYAYIDARITEDNTTPVGNRLPNAPYHSAGLWTTFQIQQGNLEGSGFGLGFNYVGSREGDLANTFEVGDYWLANAALFYERDDWRLGLNFNNIFNVDYFRVTDNRSFGNIPGAPFSVVGSISVQF